MLGRFLLLKSGLPSQLRSISFKSAITFWRSRSPVESMNPDHRLVWIDMEMTGLDPMSDHILEVACIITEGNLKIVAEHPSIVLHQSDEVLSTMNAWCIKHHGQSGLTEASRKSNVSLGMAENQLLAFLKEHTPRGKCPLAGSSVYMDRIFLTRYMPQLDHYIHYRIVDVSSIKELCRRWAPKVLEEFPVKKFDHRALSDIKESIAELQYYRKFLFK